MSAVPLRWRLTATFTASAAVVLLVLGLFLHHELRAQLDDTLRAGLRQRAQDLVPIARSRRADVGGAELVEPGDDVVQVLAADGAVVAGAQGFDRRPLLSAADRTRAARGPLLLPARPIGDEREPATLLAAPAGARIVVVGASLEDRDDALHKLDRLLALGLPAALLLAALAGFKVTGRALGPIDRIRARAEAIGTDDLGQRLPEPPAEDEVRRLARTLNAMLERLQAGLLRERSFVADASHELRTPLASLTAELELAQHPGRSPAELRDAITSAAEETQRLSRLAEDLLTVARSDAGHLPLHLEPVEVEALASRVVARAAGRGDVGVTIDAGLRVRADPLRLEQALGNLLDNALRHGAPPVTLTAVAHELDVRFEVRDEGPGVPEEFVGRAFDRFARGDDAREGPGTGLGLSIVATIAEAHGGRAGLEVGGPGSTTSWLQVPRDGPPES